MSTSDPSLAVLERAADAALFGAPLERDRDAASDHDLAREVAAFEAAIALVAVAGLEQQSPPPALVARLRELAAREGSSAANPVARIRPASGATSEPSVWSRRLPIATAAGFAIGALTTLAVVTAREAVDVDPTSFLASHPASLRCAWTGTDDPHVIGKVDGAILFDPGSGEGLIVVSGLAPNDPAAEQYQLWIFDEARDERYPVDGGVFDVDAAAATATASIPIRAKLPVTKPTLFAVTVEKPGGAVVSERRIALLARPEPAP